MARIRSVKPEFFTHPDVVSLSIPARLLLLSMVDQADDFGCLYDEPTKLRGLSFGEADRVNIGLLLAELSDPRQCDDPKCCMGAHGHILRTKANDRAVIWLPHFLKHQSIPPTKMRASVIPMPAGLLPYGSETPADWQSPSSLELGTRNREVELRGSGSSETDSSVGGSGGAERHVENDTWKYLLGRLVDADQRWADVTTERLTEAAHQYGSASVTDVLQTARLKVDDGTLAYIESPLAWFLVACRKAQQELGVTA